MRKRGKKTYRIVPWLLKCPPECRVHPTFPLWLTIWHKSTLRFAVFLQELVPLKLNSLSGSDIQNYSAQSTRIRLILNVDVNYKSGGFSMWLKQRMENLACLNSQRENRNILLRAKTCRTPFSLSCSKTHHFYVIPFKFKALRFF